MPSFSVGKSSKCMSPPFRPSRVLIVLVFVEFGIMLSSTRITLFVVKGKCSSKIASFCCSLRPECNPSLAGDSCPLESDLKYSPLVSPIHPELKRVLHSGMALSKHSRKDEASPLVKMQRTHFSSNKDWKSWVNIWIRASPPRKYSLNACRKYSSPRASVTNMRSMIDRCSFTDIGFGIWFRLHHSSKGLLWTSDHWPPAKALYMCRDVMVQSQSKQTTTPAASEADATMWPLLGEEGTAALPFLPLLFFPLGSPEEELFPDMPPI
mmetsp:Transcript_30189/g.70456  ORF Transcript_30189/g.70456 Transcript_30189/m.70456 type:complete len:266 (-) Transcript_30189:69-866(-)